MKLHSIGKRPQFVTQLYKKKKSNLVSAMRCFTFEEANLLLPAISHAAIFITTGSDTTMESHQNTYCSCSIYKVKKVGFADSVMDFIKI